MTKKSAIFITVITSLVFNVLITFYLFKKHNLIITNTEITIKNQDLILQMLISRQSIESENIQTLKHDEFLDYSIDGINFQYVPCQYYRIRNINDNLK